MEDDELQRALREWSGDMRSEDGRNRRSAARAHGQLASDEARFSGLLMDLADRACTISLTTTTGRRHAGTIVEVGDDFVALRARSDLSMFVATDALAVVEIEGTSAGGKPASARQPAGGRTFASVLADLAAVEARVRFVSGAATAVLSGRLVAMGVDVATVAVDGPPPRTLYVAPASLSELTVI